MHVQRYVDILDQEEVAVASAPMLSSNGDVIRQQRVSENKLYVQMKLAVVGVSCLVLVSCGYYEGRRLSSLTEKDLGVHFSVRPILLRSESYGWAEEGGDRALLQLAAVDCAQVGKRLDEEAPILGPESSRMFAALRVTPGHIRTEVRDERAGRYARI